MRTTTSLSPAGETLTHAAKTEAMPMCPHGYYGACGICHQSGAK